MYIIRSCSRENSIFSSSKYNKKKIFYDFENLWIAKNEIINQNLDITSSYHNANPK